MPLETITKRINKIRNSPEYSKWRKNILKRDGKKCVLCGSQEKIEVDHIKPLSLYPQLALDDGNGRVLCANCHKKTDTYGSLSKWKKEDGVHPILCGDLLYKIKTLPTYIEFNELKIGLKMKFVPFTKMWHVGYKERNGKTRVNITAKDEDIENALQSLFNKLRKS